MAKTALTRREFLRGAAAAAAAPYVITSTALGGSGRPAAGERIVMGAVGLGGQGSGDMKTFMGHRQVQMVAVCDVFKDRRETARATVDAQYGTGACTAYADFRELMARQDIDAVSVTTPEHWHALHCIEAVRNGKDVFVEKPMTLTIREARAVVEACRRHGRILQVGSQQRSDGGFRFACELVRNGRIGKVLGAETDTGGTSGPCNLPAQPVPEGFDWDMWLGPAPWAPYNRNRCWSLGAWWNWRDYSGGQMTDRGAHDFDIAQWGLGMDDTGPVEIHPPDGKEYKRLTYKYANGATLMSGELNDRGGGWRARVIFRGTEGSISVWRGGMITEPASLASAKLGPGDIQLYRSTNHAANLLECIRTRRQPVANAEVGCRSITVCHLGNLAYWLNRPLKWDPVKEEFPGDEEANRWLDRPKREPWRLG